MNASMLDLNPFLLINIIASLATLGNVFLFYTIYSQTIFKETLYLSWCSSKVCGKELGQTARISCTNREWGLVMYLSSPLLYPHLLFSHLPSSLPTSSNLPSPHLLYSPPPFNPFTNKKYICQALHCASIPLGSILMYVCKYVSLSLSQMRHC